MAAKLKKSLKQLQISPKKTNGALKDTTFIEDIKGRLIYGLNLKTVVEKPKEGRRKLEFGTRDDSKPEKTMMVLGATGSGKTTIINGVVNYIFGVKWEDDFRVKLVSNEDAPASQAHSQTSIITSYTLHHQPWFKIPYTLTIIDTPGFGDTSGIGRDQEITDQIAKFFQAKGSSGIDHVNVIGFVVQASEARLTPTQKYIFESILALFGKDIEGNINPLLTFADGKKPKVVDALKESKLPYQKFVKFNNSALYPQIDEDDDDDDDDNDDDFDKKLWTMCENNYEKLLQFVEQSEVKSLSLSADVLTERESLQVQIEGVRRGIDISLTKLNQLAEELNVVETFAREIEKSKDYTFSVMEPKVTVVPVPKGQFTTICIPCEYTCHRSCAFSKEKDKKRCSAMSKKGFCQVCPEKCSWDQHKNLPHTYDIIKVEVTKTIEDLKKRYTEATGMKVTQEKLVENLISDAEKMHRDILSQSNEAKKCIQRIKEIALRPNPLSVVNYIDLLIEAEKLEKEPCIQRIEQLNKVKRTAEILQKMEEGGYDPFDHLEDITLLKERYKKLSGGDDIFILM